MKNMGGHQNQQQQHQQQQPNNPHNQSQQTQQQQQQQQQPNHNHHQPPQQQQQQTQQQQPPSQQQHNPNQQTLHHHNTNNSNSNNNHNNHNNSNNNHHQHHNNNNHHPHPSSHQHSHQSHHHHQNNHHHHHHNQHQTPQHPHHQHQHPHQHAQQQHSLQQTQHQLNPNQPPPQVAAAAAHHQHHHQNHHSHHSQSNHHSHHHHADAPQHQQHHMHHQLHPQAIHPQQAQQLQQQQQQQAPQPQQPQPHHMPPHLINMPYHNANLLYGKMAPQPPPQSLGQPPYVPPSGHVAPQPQFDHSPATSHQSDANVALGAHASQQPVVSISNHHPGNMPPHGHPPHLNHQMHAVINPSTSGANNVHQQLANGPMMDAGPRLAQPLMLPNYAPGGFSPQMMIPSYQMAPNPMGPYHSHPHLPLQGVPLGVPPPMSVRGDLGARPQFSPHPQPPMVPPITNATPIVSQPSNNNLKPAMTVPPPVTVPVTGPTAVRPRIRERKGLAIVDPTTKHVYTLEELTDSKPTPASSEEKTSSQPEKGVPVDSNDVTSKAPQSQPILNDPKDAKQINEQISELPQKTAQDTSNDAAVAARTVASNESPPVRNEPKVTKPISFEVDETKISPTTTMDRDTLKKSSVESKSPIKESQSNDVVDHSLSNCVTQLEALEISGDIVKSESNSELGEKLAEKISETKAVEVEVVETRPRKYTIEALKEIAKKMNINFHESSSHHYAPDFAPHYVKGGPGNFYMHSQPMARRSSQQAPNKPRKIIDTQSLQQEVELNTAEKPWKPEIDKPTDIDADEMDTQRLLKVFRGHLNKLTPQKYDSIMEKIEILNICLPERLSSVIDMVFDKAVDEPGFCELYARVCKVLAIKNTEFSFHLVRKCQEEFETADLYHGLDVEDRKALIEQETDPAKKKYKMEELYEDMRLKRKKYLGTIKLIGEMYKLGLLLPKIIALCMKHLMENPSNENLECLCSLLATVGQKILSEQNDEIKKSLRTTINVLSDFTQSSKVNELFVLESRVKFKILDTIDLSKRNWRPRMVENNPKKLEEIRDEAVRDESSRHQSFHNHSNFSKSNIFKNDSDKSRRNLGHQYSRK